MERKLLLLGLLRSQEMSGYQLNELIDSHMRASVQLKKPTAYRLLSKMADDGWITYTEEREGNRPLRRVYAITPKGEAAFQQLLRDSLADYSPAEFRSAISLAFLDALPAEERLSLLRKRNSVIKNLLQTALTHGDDHGGFRLLTEHQIRHLSTDLEWLSEVIARLESDSQDHVYAKELFRQELGKVDIPPQPQLDGGVHTHRGVGEGDTVPQPQMKTRDQSSPGEERLKWCPETD